MTSRQTIPKQWVIVDETPNPALWKALCRLPLKSGVLAIHSLNPGAARRLRQLAKRRRLTIAAEKRGTAARVHDMHELRQALLSRAPIVLISPLYPTCSHPDWRPLPRMRAATFARLASRNAVALGGMNQQRYAKIAPLGFIAWAGISAFRT